MTGDWDPEEDADEGVKEMMALKAKSGKPSTGEESNAGIGSGSEASDEEEDEDDKEEQKTDVDKKEGNGEENSNKKQGVKRMKGALLRNQFNEEVDETNEYYNKMKEELERQSTV